MVIEVTGRRLEKQMDVVEER